MRLNWGTGIAAVYTAFALMTIGFVVFAMEQPVDLVSDDYYAESLRHDQRMAAERNVQALAGHFACAVSDDGRSIRLSLPRDQAGVAQGAVVLYRPSDSSEDRSWPLALDDEATQRLSLPDLATGLWRVKVTWDVAGTPYYYERDLDVR